MRISYHMTKGIKVIGLPCEQFCSILSSTTIKTNFSSKITSKKLLALCNVPTARYNKKLQANWEKQRSDRF